MATGVIQKLMGNKHGSGGGIIRPTTANGVEIVGQDIYFNARDGVNLGEDDAPLGVGDVVSYTHIQRADRGVGGGPVTQATPSAVAIERVARGDAQGQQAPWAPQATRENAGPSIEQQMRSSDRYKAI